MSVSDDVSREILQLLGYEEMVKIGYTGEILGDIFKRQFKHKSLMKYIKPDKEFYIPKDLMEKMRDKVPHFFRYCNFVIGGKFILLENADWDELSLNTCLTEDIIEKYEKKWNWQKLSSNTCLTKEIIDAYPDKWDWVFLSLNPCLTEEIIDKYKDDWNFYLPDVERNDSILVEVVEELGEEANGNSATLKIVEIPDDVEWIIEEDEGREWVSEKHRTWR